MQGPAECHLSLQSLLMLQKNPQTEGPGWPYSGICGRLAAGPPLGRGPLEQHTGRCAGSSLAFLSHRVHVCSQMPCHNEKYTTSDEECRGPEHQSEWPTQGPLLLQPPPPQVASPAQPCLSSSAWLTLPSPRSVAILTQECDTQGLDQGSRNLFEMSAPGACTASRLGNCSSSRWL